MERDRDGNPKLCLFTSLTDAQNRFQAVTEIQTRAAIQETEFTVQTQPRKWPKTTEITFNGEK